MKKAKQLEIENAILRKVIAEVQDRVRKENLTGEYAHEKAVGAIQAITDANRIQHDITMAAENVQYQAHWEQRAI